MEWLDYFRVMNWSADSISYCGFVGLDIWDDSVSTPVVFAQIVASIFSHANVAGKVLSRIRHPKQFVCVELNYEHSIHYHQHLDSLHKVRNVRLNYENFSYVLSEGNNVG